ncbi:hypothetical protein CsSME_00010712 [Camellia sinensis var. sinensis]|uniref:uncharacterized protein LOC114258029 isoform X1 n=1 Tax=Camellia sinensis TaxID=4442 RepID=UPI001036C1F3|nr:uncharacterized protein LOC114258029 isoform X1 [Camellia sinensis]XP_028053675.1 uncharacterized protein LOC114258029 isoform X1 [Camellia sinensis]XP_028053676.1 uncharacterized protein LOC114258029 isoform X1 [Camellia sinensis]
MDVSLNETGGNVIRNLVWVSEPVANRLNAWMSEGEWLTSWREKDYANIYSTCCTKLTCLLENPSFTLREVFMFNHLKCKEIACYQVLLSPKEPENNVTFFWGRAMAASSEDICSSSDTSTLTIVEEFCRRE